ncbi:MAG: 23S rRNA (uracil(1939)-C(5))-methyltransferase RlmD [Ignavibacteria bacterium]|nr:23S rRNA (uracil(1939)-C(5))-methyltransferase RlmD [Ignavibacteria bacterium]
MYQKGMEYELLIEDISTESFGIAKHNNFVVLVPYTVPGDRIKAIIRKVKKNYAIAEISDILENSPLRVDPECRHFTMCNGCKLQNMNYQAQLNIKRNIVKNTLERIGGFVNINVEEILSSEKIFYYRNKLEYSFSSERWLLPEEIGKENLNKDFSLGYRIPGFHEKVIDIENCLLQSEISNRILNLTRDFFIKSNIKPYSTFKSNGSLRYLVIRQSAYTSEIMVNIITRDYIENVIKEYADELKKNIKEVTTLIHSVSVTKAQVADAKNYRVIYGKGYITEKLGKYKFKILPTTFFQTNSYQAEKLFNTVIKIGEFTNEETVLDLYCGCGAISFFVSDYVRSVTGVEQNEEAVKSACSNAEINRISNCSFVESDVNLFLKNLLHSEKRSQYNCIIVDPPRSGLHPEVVKNILWLQPEKIIYVSCNPSTQARDLKILSQKYNIKTVIPVDMFPQTMHVENIVKLNLKF